MKEWLLKTLFGVVATATGAFSAPITSPPQPAFESKIIERQTIVREVQNSATYEAKISALDKRVAALEKRIAELEAKGPEEKVKEQVEVVREIPIADPRISVLEKIISDFKDEQLRLHDILDKQTNILCRHSYTFGGDALRFRCHTNTWWLEAYPL
ncbi:MAG: hypothetical protein Q8R35_01565 [bacterium]|nr:hypothetical protein [bacterium]